MADQLRLMTRIREEEDYVENIKWLHSGQNWNRNRNKGYTRENWNQYQLVLPQCKTMLIPSERIHKFHCTDDGTFDCKHNFLLI